MRSSFKSRMRTADVKLPPSPCPHCGKVLDMADCLSKDSATPKPGDISLCNNCWEPMEFGEDLTHLPLSEATIAELGTAKMETLRALKLKIAKAKNSDTEMGAKFEAQCQKMYENFLQWRKDHPDAEVKVQFNYPPHVCVIGPISAALDNKLVSANEDGLALLKALWPWNDQSEPTVNMCRIVLENKRPSFTCPKCGLTSYNANDIEQKYCGKCHEHHYPI